MGDNRLLWVGISSAIKPNRAVVVIFSEPVGVSDFRRFREEAHDDRSTFNQEKQIKPA
jgi:hypothetical protein